MSEAFAATVANFRTNHCKLASVGACFRIMCLFLRLSRLVAKFIPDQSYAFN